MVIEDSLAALVTCHVSNALVISRRLTTKGESDTRVVVLAHFTTLSNRSRSHMNMDAHHCSLYRSNHPYIHIVFHPLVVFDGPRPRGNRILGNMRMSIQTNVDMNTHEGSDSLYQPSLEGTCTAHRTWNTLRSCRR